MMDDRVTEELHLGGAPGILTIDLGALRQNYLALSAMAAPARTAAVVKADAYGLGIDLVVPVLFDAGPEVPYERRADRLRTCGVALWDVCRAARRPGSLDASIDVASVVPNDFRGFFLRHGAIRAVFTNGGTATRLYARLVLPRLPEPARSLPLHPLPSTSPAHASLRFEQKLARWEAVAIAVHGSAPE